MKKKKDIIASSYLINLMYQLIPFGPLDLWINLLLKSDPENFIVVVCSILDTNSIIPSIDLAHDLHDACKILELELDPKKDQSTHREKLRSMDEMTPLQIDQLQHDIHSYYTKEAEKEYKIYREAKDHFDSLCNALYK